MNNNFKNIGYLGIFFLIVLIIWWLLFYNLLFKGEKNFEQLTFHGTINYITKESGERATFILVDSVWYGILTTRVEEYIEVGDSIVKRDSTDKILIYRNYRQPNDTSKVFHNSSAFKVSNKSLLRSLDLKYNHKNLN
jgi:hypothetical protein